MEGHALSCPIMRARLEELYGPGAMTRSTYNAVILNEVKDLTYDLTSHTFFGDVTT